jgi:hypothetical protein
MSWLLTKLWQLQRFRISDEDLKEWTFVLRQDSYYTNLPALPQHSLQDVRGNKLACEGP